MEPILFNIEMVRAIMEGRKTVTRRAVKLPYHPGDILWVRETWNGDWCDHYIYKADGGSAKAAGYAAEPKWRPSIHMPREAARLFLRVTDVRVERLQDINLIAVWDRTIKPADLHLYGWDANPWIQVIEFERISKDEALGGEGGRGRTTEGAG